MRILYCIPALHNAGGMERVLTEKVNYLAIQPDYEIFIITTEQLNRPIRFLLNENVTVIHFNIDFNSHYSVGLFRKYISHKKKLKVYKSKLIEQINLLKIGMCISLCGKEIDFLYKLNVHCIKIAEIHFAMNIRKQFLTSRHSSFIWNILGKIRTKQLIRSVKKLDKLIVLTQSDKEQWQKSCSNVLKIQNPNPLSNKEFASLDTKNAITVGRLDPQKGYDMLIEAWVVVSNNHPDWNLSIWGQGEYENELEDMIKRTNMSDKVKLCGLSSDIVSEYLNSSIYVMSSRYEGLPMVLIEAMSCGLPVVSFDCECGPREIITDGIDGFLVEPNNVQELANKICTLIENTELRMKFGAKAIEKSELFSMDRIMNEWILLFDDLVKKRSCKF